MISKIKHILSLRPRSSKVFLTVEQQSEHFFPTTGQNKLGNKIPLFSPLLVSKLTMPLGSLSYIAFPVIMINILNLYGLVCVSALFSFPVYLLIYILYESTLQYTEFSMTTPYGNTAVNYQEMLLAKLPHCELFHIMFYSEKRSFGLLMYFSKCRTIRLNCQTMYGKKLPNVRTIKNWSKKPHIKNEWSFSINLMIEIRQKYFDGLLRPKKVSRV